MTQEQLALDLFEEQADELARAIDGLCAAAYEYNTEHKDAGDNYAHMPCEQWCENDTQRLTEWLAYHNVKSSLDSDVIATLILDNFHMESGHMFSDYGPHIFELAGYPVGEIETQIDREEIIGAVAYPVSDELIAEAIDGCSSYLVEAFGDNETWFAYRSTDAVWFAHITLETVKQLIADEEAQRLAYAA